MVEVFCDSFEQVPRRILLDIDDTEDRLRWPATRAVQRLLRQRYFQPLHIYEAITARPATIILRPGKTPDGAEVALVLRHVIGYVTPKRRRSTCRARTGR